MGMAMVFGYCYGLLLWLSGYGLGAMTVVYGYGYGYGLGATA